MTSTFATEPEALDPNVSSGDSPESGISIVVCSRNRPEMLDQCLAVEARQVVGVDVDHGRQAHPSRLWTQSTRVST